MTITGYAAFKILVPIACVFFSGYLLWRKEILRVVAQKFLLFGLAVYLVIPASVKVADMIETTYASSIESTIETAKQTTDEIESETGESGQVDDKSSNENPRVIQTVTAKKMPVDFSQDFLIKCRKECPQRLRMWRMC